MRRTKGSGGCASGEHSAEIKQARFVIVFISAADTDLLSLEGAIRQLPAAFPAVRAFLSTRLQTDAEIDAMLADVGADARIFVVRVLGGRSFFERGFERLRELCESRQRLLLAFPGDQHPDPELAALSNVPLADLSAAFEYLIAGGAANYKDLLLFLADIYLSTAYGFAAPAPAPSDGLYHPDASDTLACATRGLKAFRRAHWTEGRPAIGVLFYRAHWQSGNLAVVDALVREIESHECNVLPVFCYSLRDEVVHADGAPRAYSHYFSEGSHASVDCIVSLLSYALAELQHGERTTRAGSAAPDYTTTLGIPVIQAITTSLTVEEWRASERGITPLDAAMNVVMPEFDGRIISAPLTFKHEAAGASRKHVEVRRSVSTANRLQAVAALALRHAELRRKPNAEKRLCIMLTNFANKQGRIGGAVGLDTPASVIELLRALKQRGYRIGEIPPDGDALMAELIASGGYDQDFLTDEQMRRATARYAGARYAQWFGEFPAQNQSALRQAWGEPPGEVYRDGDHVYVAGLRFGNVLVMIQPPRGFGENPLAVYHSGDLIPTHQYLGAYRWLREEFRADALVHCGKHGTLEWLPGKGLGLSEACYPELAIGDIPVFYPFIVNDPGEGTQAKRRMHACIIDHLIPPMTRAETYDDLARLQQLLGDYAHAERIDPDKLPLIRQAIWEVVVGAKLHHDLGLTEQPRQQEYGAFIQHIDGYLCEIGDMQIRDGLHVLGRAPEGTGLVDLALALVRVDMPKLMGLRRALATDLGLDYDRVSNTADLGTPWGAPDDKAPAFFAHLQEGTPYRTQGDILNAIERFARCMVARLAAGDFDPKAIGNTLNAFDLPAHGRVVATLGALAHRIVPDLRRATDEISNLLDGLEGRFVPAGPSGAPTRGMADVLPTGRNFYSVDVRAVPSVFAWKVGSRLGAELLNRHLEKAGRYPESVGITIWGTSNMRTQGDDIAEVLWLLGVRPLWQEENRRVADLEVIPLEDLGRPRIDVTVRMSGFFRDAFPGVVKLLDRAINLVADRDEPDERNFVRRHAWAEEAVLITRGQPGDVARMRSRFRLFSNKPGAYGTGILSALSEQNWETSEDLARIYLEWGSFAYTGEIYGEPAGDEFRARLAAVEIAVQNQDNREHDIFDSDDYLQFHGGMIAAIRALSGRQPLAMFGDSSDPERARVRDLEEEARRVFRSRVANPRWLSAMRRHGYKGGLEMAATVDYLFGYDATAGVIEDWMYEQVAEKYVFDAESREFLERSNPWALHEMAGRLLEAHARRMWAAPEDDTIACLQAAYLASEGVLEAKGTEDAQ
ncbi:MAG: cobaltochelatase subunit CobN [Gammaproteobacteria bacterium]